MRVTLRVSVTVAAPVALAVFMRRVTAHPDLPDIGDRDRRLSCHSYRRSAPAGAELGKH
ncbi:MAG TPA: hypothetical protein VGU70_03645 [Methylobacterium sp.]|uniref:hypothetical protein n=1 Tax=Methylorubrum sp. B1-46 TaxID=2897334 RepID=UPI001E316521|nr:hypothetical protein [Methylorubrum sp. B1-46]HEV2541842.1 hypothetical protein [Methylobacterium sp.]